MMIGLPGLLTLLFVFFKIRGDIDWPWWLVFSPLWAAALLGAVIGILKFIGEEK